MKRPAVSTLLFISGVAAVIVALLGVSWILLSLERSERRAVAMTRHLETMRLSLWRMDSWLAPRIAAESVRPYFEYLSFYPQDRAYTRILNEIEKGEVLTPSPLLSFNSELIPLHFQINDEGVLTSPQAPVGNQLDLAQTCCSDPTFIDAHRKKLEHLAPNLSITDLRQGIQRTEQLVRSISPPEIADLRLADAAPVIDSLATTAAPANPTSRPPTPQPPPVQTGQTSTRTPDQSGDRSATQTGKGSADWAKRSEASNYNAQSLQQAESDIFLQQARAMPDVEAPNAPDVIDVGQFLPVWLNQGQTLAYVRRVGVNNTTLYQGFIVDWPTLQQSLLTQVDDLVENASLEPVCTESEADAHNSTMLAAVPARLIASPAPSDAQGDISSRLTPARLALILVWLAAAGALVASWFTIRASALYAEKRSRFASTVTHELRTPLTTFQLYSEMLADDMIKDPDQRQRYLRTLQQESGRLATLVENVLSFARIEQKRFQPHLSSTTLSALINRLADRLNPRVRQGHLDLLTSVETDVDIHVDEDAVGQIIANLIDNAAKYAVNHHSATTQDHRVHLEASADDRTISIRVRDHGPGVSPSALRNLFKPFERGDAHNSEANHPAPPGVGLGLALCRELARQLGGDLTYAPAPAGGAVFVLSLPVKPASA